MAGYDLRSPQSDVILNHDRKLLKTKKLEKVGVLFTGASEWSFYKKKNITIFQDRLLDQIFIEDFRNICYEEIE